MNVGLHAVFVIVAVVLFALAAISNYWWTQPKLSLTAAGLFFWALSDLVP